MTKEELIKEATSTVEWECTSMIDRPLFVRAYITGAEPREKRIEELENENAELKSRIGMSIECDKAQKNGELCLGYGGDEDEPCEQCKNCINCECGYYQLGETEKDEQFTKAKDLLRRWQQANICDATVLFSQTEDFLREVEENDR